MKNKFLNFWVYIYPFPALWLFYRHWEGLLDHRFALYMLLVPLLYGYIMPGIAVNIMKKWKFNTKFRLGNYYAHHGFKISGNMNTWIFLASFHSGFHELTLAQALTLSAATGGTMAFFTFLHDTELIRSGKLEMLNQLSTPDMSPESKAYSYAPLSFFVLGSSYAFSAVMAYKHFSTTNDFSLTAIAWPIVLGCTFVSTMGSLAYGLLEYQKRHR